MEVTCNAAQAREGQRCQHSHHVLLSGCLISNIREGSLFCPKEHRRSWSLDMQELERSAFWECIKAEVHCLQASLQCMSSDLGFGILH